MIFFDILSISKILLPMTSKNSILFNYSLNLFLQRFATHTKYRDLARTIRPNGTMTSIPNHVDSLSMEVLAVNRIEYINKLKNIAVTYNLLRLSWQ